MIFSHTRLITVMLIGSGLALAKLTDNFIDEDQKTYSHIV